MEVRVPKLADGVEAGAIVSIFVSVGDSVKEGQDLLELETEKATASLPSPQAGKVDKIHVSVGDSVKVGQVLVSISEGGSSGKSTAKQESPAVVGAHGRAPLRTEVAIPTAPRPQPIAAPAQPAAAQGVSPKLAQVGLGLPASPTVKKIAFQLGIDLTYVAGSEHGGRITIDDLKAYIAGLQSAAANASAAVSTSAGVAVAAKPAATPLPDFSKWGKVRTEKMSSLRKIISQRMTESWTTVPHVTQYDEANITSLAAIAKKYAPEYEKKGAKLTLTVLLLKAVTAVLKKYPVFNATIDEANQQIIFKDYYNLGIAVDTEQGLIVPVIRNVDQKSTFELSQELKDLADRTKQRKVALDELQGGTFTISNQGGIGGGAFTPIINKPEVAILGLARGVQKAVVKDKKIEVAMVLPLSLSYDHRLIDGGSAARFISDLVKEIENFNEANAKLTGNSKSEKIEKTSSKAANGKGTKKK